ncbi:MAG: glycosyltransferase [Chitinophagaceae bacterium]|nr:MAG: glycosyltransferase [Chitinophagaceae bacterium]
MNDRSHIISLNIHNLSFENSLNQITEWGLNQNNGFVCFANSHMTVHAHKFPAFKAALSKAKLILPDGKPLAIACNLLYRKKQERISGMDFMPALLNELNKKSASVFLYGSTELVLTQLTQKFNLQYPNVTIVGSISPSFAGVSAEETAEHIRLMNESKAQFVLVALGCPKQETWMATHYNSINALLLGVGGAFPVVAGVQKRSPKIMQSLSLEWLYRLKQEPRRLFKRYLFTNMSFLYLLSKEMARKHILLKKPGTPRPFPVYNTTVNE